MIDLNLLRENPETIRVSQRARGASVELVDQAIELDKIKRQAQSEFEKLRAEQNAHGKLVASAAKEEKAALVEKAQALAANVKQAEAKASELEAELNQLLMKIDNVVVEGVPSGGEENFKVLREVGKKPSFSFAAKDHAYLGEHLDIIDIERGVKISGSRFYFLKGYGARLELA